MSLTLQKEKVIGGKIEMIIKKPVNSMYLFNYRVNYSEVVKLELLSDNAPDKVLFELQLADFYNILCALNKTNATDTMIPFSLTGNLPLSEKNQLRLTITNLKVDEALNEIEYHFNQVENDGGLLHIKKLGADIVDIETGVYDKLIFQINKATEFETFSNNKKISLNYPYLQLNSYASFVALPVNDMKLTLSDSPVKYLLDIN